MKHVEVYSKNKFEKLVLIVGFIIRIYNDARSPGLQIRNTCCFKHCHNTVNLKKKQVILYILQHNLCNNIAKSM